MTRRKGGSGKDILRASVSTCCSLSQSLKGILLPGLSGWAVLTEEGDMSFLWLGTGNSVLVKKNSFARERIFRC